MADEFLPSELWLMVWLHLPQSDLVSVSRTCQHWRILALGYPHLWADVEFSYDPDSGASNLSLVHELLPRSRPHALAFRMDVPCASKTTLLGDMCELLGHETNRLATLQIHSRSSLLLTILLAQFPVMPALRRLTLTGSELETQFEVTSFMSRSLEMPLLDHLHLGDGLAWPTSRHKYPKPANLRNLRYICTAPKDARSILTILDGCHPNLQLLDLRMHRLAPQHTLELLLSQSHRFPAVRFSRVESMSESLIMEILEDPGFRDVFVELDDKHACEPGRLFTAASGPANVTLRTRGDAFEIEASGASGLRRGIALLRRHPVISRGLGSCIPCSSVARATVDFAEWSCFISNADCFANLSQLSIQLRTTTSLGEDTYLGACINMFPALHILRFDPLDPAGGKLGTTAVAFVDALQLSHCLHTISLPKHLYAHSPSHLIPRRKS